MKKYLIGYTSGVFDLFHIGHLNILKKAKEQCDFLIVGVSSDKLVENYKGKKTVIPFSQRKEIIEAVKYVDKVVTQVTLDKMEAFGKYGFNVVFVGDDWKNSKSWKIIEEKFSTVGVDIVWVEYTKSISTTKLIATIRENK